MLFYSRARSNAILLPREMLCEVMQYLRLDELMCSARGVSSQWSVLPLERCYKPDRISLVPLCLLMRLYLRNRQAFNNSCIIVEERATFEFYSPPNWTFPVQHVLQLSSGIRDCRDQTAEAARKYANAIRFANLQECVIVPESMTLPFSMLKCKIWTVCFPVVTCHSWYRFRHALASVDNRVEEIRFILNLPVFGLTDFLAACSKILPHSLRRLSFNNEYYERTDAVHNFERVYVQE